MLKSNCLLTSSYNNRWSTKKNFKKKYQNIWILKKLVLPLFHHQINNSMENQMNEILEKTGLNWNVNLEDIQTTSGIVIPDKFALIRSDNQTSLGVHSKTYVPYQNHELLELLFKISKSTGLDLHTGGSFKGGQRVWFQLKSQDLNLNGDKIKGYISGFNSFDGRTSLGFGNSNVTVSCQNTFWLGYHGVETKLRHSSTMKPKLEEIIRQVDLLIEEEKQTFNNIKMLSETRYDNTTKEKVIRKLFDISKEENLMSDDFSTNKKNKMSRFYIDLNGELQQKGDNLWGLFSGVTKYTTHSMKKGDNSENKIFGGVGNTERQIFKDLLELV